MKNHFKIETQESMFFTKANNHNKIQKRYLRTLLAEYWNKVAIRANKKVLESQERNYALKGYRIKPETVDVKPIYNNFLYLSLDV